MAYLKKLLIANNNNNDFYYIIYDIITSLTKQSYPKPMQWYVMHITKHTGICIVPVS